MDKENLEELKKDPLWSGVIDKYEKGEIDIEESVDESMLKRVKGEQLIEDSIEEVIETGEDIEKPMDRIIDRKIPIEEIIETPERKKLSSIQISMELRDRMKSLKRDLSYEEFIKIMLDKIIE
jgi:hypothetical protein